MKPIDGDGARWPRRVIAEDAPIASWRRMFAASTDTMQPDRGSRLRARWLHDMQQRCTNRAPGQRLADQNPKNKRKLIPQIAPNQSKKTKTKPNQNQKTKTKKKDYWLIRDPQNRKRKKKKEDGPHLVLFGFGLGVSDDESIFFALFGFRFFLVLVWLSLMSQFSLFFCFGLFWFGCFVYIVSKYHHTFHLNITSWSSSYQPHFIPLSWKKKMVVSSQYHLHIISI